MKQIPKVIHYCWFGRKPMPKLALKCIASWKEYLPDYEIKEWNEDNFDVNIIPYTKDAYNAGKYAFVSDYARFWILYYHGGVYFDVDVEVIKPMNDILMKGQYMGCELSFRNEINVAPGLGMAAFPQEEIYKELLDLYSGLKFYNSDGSMNLTTIVKYTTDVLSKYGFVKENRNQECLGIYIYATDYFCPINNRTKKCVITDNTYSIHHFAATWVPWSSKVMKLKRFFFTEEQISAISRFLDHFRKNKKSV